jgi:hypothetical protein
MWMLLLGCPVKDPAADCAAVEWYADADADGHGSATETADACDAPEGFVAVSGDCDDTDAGVFPGATEACDGADQDCDGAADDGLSAYADADGDGYGDIAATVPCAEGVDDTADCDDGAEAVHPGADELCNGRDDDCDGASDEETIDTPSWFVDLDADGWGAGTAIAVQCEPITGHSSLSGDCADGDPAISPGAEEICDNGVDEDCDGGGCRIEGDWDPGSHAEFTILGDTESEWVLEVGPLWVGSQRGLFVATYNHLYLFRSVPSGEYYVSEADADVPLGAHAGASRWSSLGDVDGDGDSDLGVVGGDSFFVVSADVAAGTVDDVATLALSDSSNLSPYWRHANDADGDGFPEIALGDSAGRAWVVPLTASGQVTDRAMTTVAGDGGRGFGYSVDLGDLDGDGVADLVVGEPDFANPYGMGAAYVYLGPLSGALAAADADAAPVDSTGLYFGQGVQIEADLDGDGVAELLVRKSAAEGNPQWALFDGADATARAYFGDSINGLTVDTGDLDGDRQADLVVGTTGEGSIYYGPVPDGVHDASDDDATVLGDAYRLAPAMRFLGDLDRDGFDDLAVFSVQADTPAARLAGQVWGLMGSNGF